MILLTGIVVSMRTCSSDAAVIDVEAPAAAATKKQSRPVASGRSSNKKASDSNRDAYVQRCSIGRLPIDQDRQFEV